MLVQARVVPQRRILCRGVASYSPKVRAFPFKVSPAEAIQQLAMTPASGTDISTRLSTRFGSTPPIQPKKIVPVYFPAWFIDGEMEAEVIPSNSDSKSANGYVTAVFLNSYLPGHTMDKLSSISLLSESLAVQTEAVPFTADLETQWDTKITCLPFKTAPFSILDAANSLTSEQCRVSDVFSLDPSSIRTNLICAYPVLIPLYLAQYAADTTVVLEAHDSEAGRILEERGADEPVLNVHEVEPEGVRTVVNSIRKLGIPPPKPSDGPITRFLLNSARYLETQMTDVEKKLEEVEAELAGLFRYHRGSPTQFVNIAALTIPRHGQAKIDQMTDPRIRPFTVDEVIAVRKFLWTGQERAKAHTLLDSMSKVKATGAPENQNHKDFKEYVESFDAQRRKATPSWWKEWMESSTQK
ncbi:hypothetical protein MVEN_02496600 [Mycena venus]|uniref:Uncharacterized protein n=1 Tax=Mycena venus TaxID=2733690 RepID=A0A8H7CAT8_9AGAR|nr:hypothetical protein MVEN_02496600 [Mycena venus]